MKFFHISDLHIGRQMNGYSLRDSQENALSRIIAYAQSEKPDAVLICGDIYDKSVPSADSYTVFDSFLIRLSSIRPSIPVLIIAGNHDSPERLSYASSFLERHQIYISALPPSSPEDRLKKVTFEDRWGKINFYLVPLIKPGYVRHLFEEGAVTGYDSAFRAVLSREEINGGERNVILAHQFFTSGDKGPSLCDSESAILTLGGLDQIDVSALADFDYAALGHLHGPQKVGREDVRYSGTPYKYSVSEERHRKAVTVVTMEEKGVVKIESLPLECVPEVRRLRGTLTEVLAMADSDNCHDYLSITLTDEAEVFDRKEQLEETYDHILEIRIDNERTRRKLREDGEKIEVPDPFEAFGLFYEAVRHCPMTKEQREMMYKVIEEAKDGEVGR